MIPGFLNSTSDRSYQLTSISKNEVRFVSVDNPEDIPIQEYIMNTHIFRLK